MAGQVVNPVGDAHCGDLCREGGDEGQTVGARGDGGGEGFGRGGCGGMGGHVAGACVWAGPVVVLYQRVDGAADAQREFYHVRGGFSDRVSLAGKQEGGGGGREKVPFWDFWFFRAMVFLRIMRPKNRRCERDIRLVFDPRQ